MTYRIGFGYDTHVFEVGRPLWLGGINIPFEKGLLGHSDADVLLHAICDAMLGAAALGDIGIHFPNNDPAYKGIDSKVLLQKTLLLLQTHGYTLVNLDSTVCAERPKLAPFIPQMRQTIASLLSVPIDCISIKATTNEKLGYVGREEGINAYAVALISKS